MSSPLSRGVEIEPSTPTLVAAEAGEDFDGFLRKTDTLTFVVVHSDELVYERYFAGSSRQTLETSFSVAKSVVSTLVGIAIDEGAIGSVEDPVTDYVPSWRSAIRGSSRSPCATCSRCLPASAIRSRISPALGRRHSDLLGRTFAKSPSMALRSCGRPGRSGCTTTTTRSYSLLSMSVSEYMASRLWQPLGAEQDASWSLDSEESGFEKMESGLNATAVDYARFGALYLHNGEWNGSQIVSADWIRAATAADTSTDPNASYQYFWWVDLDRPGRFYGLGNYGQYLYVAPDTNTVIVRLGRDWGVDNGTWLATFHEIADSLR